MNYRYCLGQEGLTLQRNVDTLLLAVKQADGCEPRALTVMPNPSVFDLTKVFR